MQKQRYALVAYVRGPAGELVESLRRELHPEVPHFAAHLTILPPRPLLDTESSALQQLERVCSQEEPFEVQLGPVETFVPITPTVFICVDSVSRMCALHKRLNEGVFAFKEEWPYIPHLTIAKMNSEQLAKSAFEIASQRWNQFQGSRRVLVEKLTFVREDAQNCWVDLAPVPLGRTLVSH
jgi:2'-5' RNA ligase